MSPASLVLTHLLACKSSEILDDEYGAQVSTGSVDNLRRDFEGRCARLGSRQAAIDELATLRWGPIDLSLLQVLFSMLFSVSDERASVLAKADFLFSLPLSPDLTDIAGNSALVYVVGTMSFFDEDFARMLYEGRAEANHTDRGGETPASRAACRLFRPTTEMAFGSVFAAAEWLSGRGANFEAPGVPAPRHFLEASVDLVPPPCPAEARGT